MLDSSEAGHAVGPPKQSIRKRLLLSHLIIATVGVLPLLCVLAITLWFRTHVLELTTQRGPTALAAYGVANAVQKSLAQLRGWIAVEDPSFKQMRMRTWREEVEPRLAGLIELSEHWEQPQDLRQLARLKTLLADLEASQWWSQEVAHTPGNHPANIEYMENCLPIAENIGLLMDSLIGRERQKRPQYSRHVLLDDMVDFRYSFSRCHLQLGSFLDVGAFQMVPNIRGDFDSSRQLLVGMGKAHQLFDDAQTDLFAEIVEEWEAYGYFLDRVIGIRDSPQWNLVRLWMAEETIPLAEETTALLTELAETQADRMQAGNREVSANANHSIWVFVMLLIAMTVAVCYLSYHLTKRIMSPIGNLVQATRRIREGQDIGEMPIVHQDELGELVADFNAMNRSIVENEQHLRHKRDQLRRSLKEKEVLFHELNHRVKNNLQVVSSLLDLQSMSSGNQELGDKFREGRDRIISMSLIHETLYSNHEGVTVNLADYIQRLTESLFDAYGVDPGSIDLVLEIGGQVLSLDQAVPCGLILNELLSNTLKYAFPGGRQGRVYIRVQEKTRGLCMLEITDDGVGLGSGLDPEHTESMGLTIVRTLVKQLRGNSVWTGDQGVSVRITWPLNNDLPPSGQKAVH